MTPSRFTLAVCLFNLAALAVVAFAVRQWQKSAPTWLTPRGWWRFASLTTVLSAIAVYAASLASVLAANVGLDMTRVHVGPISLRLLGQGLFIYAPLLAFALARLHFRFGARARAHALVAAGLLLCAIHVDAYYIEPQSLRVERHATRLTRGTAATGSTRLRILHMTDVQTPEFGDREKEAYRRGLALKPDLIVLTGDYLQSALGRPTIQQATRDMRTFLRELDFGAPLGAFATEGDTGPACRDVFEGTRVRCLVDASALVTLPNGDRLAVSGLSRGRGRERRSDILEKTIDPGAPVDHHFVISHAPDFVSALKEPIDLALAGHTHGGQVVLPFLGPPKTAIRLPRRYAGGLNDYKGTPLHVSRGVGMERGFDIPVRFLCRPEICLIDVTVE